MATILFISDDIKHLENQAKLLEEAGHKIIFLSAIEKMLHIGAAKKFLGKRRIIRGEQLIA